MPDILQATPVHVHDSNRAAVEHAFAEWSRTKGGSIDIWEELVAPDARLGSLSEGIPDGEFAAGKSGKAQIREALEAMLDNWKMKEWAVETTVADGDQVFVKGHCAWTHRKTGKDFASPVMAYFRFENGKIKEYFETMDTLRLAEAATPS